MADTVVPFTERETTIIIDYETKLAFVYSSHPKKIKILLDFVHDYPDETAIEFMAPDSMEIAVPINWIKVKPPTKRPKSAENLKKKKITA